MLNTVVQLDAPGDIFVEKATPHPDSFLIDVEKDMPLKGQLTLIQGDEVVDEYEWDARYAPIAGPPSSTAAEPAILSASETFEYPIELGSLMHPTESVPVPALAQPDEDVPSAIRESLARFRKDHLNSNRTGFILMRFGSTPAHDTIAQTIKDTLASHGLEAVRADDKEYHSDLYNNIETYLHGCGFGIAVFERFQSDDFNPNVALEVGYMFAQRKPVCLLKDKTLQTLHADLVGKLFRQFDPQAIRKSIPKQLNNWLRDQGLL
jgi:hypothetical protein